MVNFLRKLAIMGIVLIAIITQDNFIAKVAVGILSGIAASIFCAFMEYILGYSDNQKIEEETKKEKEGDENEDSN